MAAINLPYFRPVVDLSDGGPHATDTGTTTLLTIDGTPVRRRVRLHDQPTGRIVRETWSDAATGQWRFENIRAGTYYAVAFDHTGAYSGVVETDIVVPTPPGGA
jgi:hypothetical protein